MRNSVLHSSFGSQCVTIVKMQNLIGTPIVHFLSILCSKTLYLHIYSSNVTLK